MGYADRTTLNNLTPNMDISDVADPALRLAAFQYLYNLSDQNYAYLQSLVTSGTLSPYPPDFVLRQGIVNGMPLIWQRGTTFNSAQEGDYTADRWSVNTGLTNTVNVTRQSGSKLYCIRAERSAGNAVWGINQKMDTYRSMAYRGKTATFSVSLRKSSLLTSGLSIQVYKSSVTDNFSSLSTLNTLVIANESLSTTDFITFSITFIVPTDTTNLLIRVESNAQSGASGVYFEAENMALNEGSAALSNQPIDFYTELLNCLHFYESTFDYGAAIGTATGAGTVVVPCDNANYLPGAQFKVKKRTIPTIKTYSGSSGTANRVRVAGTGSEVASAVTYANIGTSGFSSINSTGAFTSGTLYAFHYTADAEL